MKRIRETPPGKYLPAKYVCPRNHGGNTRLIAVRISGRMWIECVGCHAFFHPEAIPDLARYRAH